MNSESRTLLPPAAQEPHHVYVQSYVEGNKKQKVVDVLGRRRSNGGTKEILNDKDE